MSIVLLITRIQRKIRVSSGCNYLYKYFQELVEQLNLKNGFLSDEESLALKELIGDYAADSRYNNFASANWMRYSARCFYCADSLLCFLKNEHEQIRMRTMLNDYFIELVKNHVAPIIPYDVLEKYIQNNVNQSNAREFYDTLIRKAIEGCRRSRLWRGDEISLAYAYTESANRLMMEYIHKYSDESVLKEWIPLFETPRLAKYWYEYPESGNYYHSGDFERNVVMDNLDKMLDIHLELFSYWYGHNPEELINEVSLNDFIDILEVVEDEEFERILCHAVTLPYNEKVREVLKHFEHDDEQWIVELSRQLLGNYRKTFGVGTFSLW